LSSFFCLIVVFAADDFLAFGEGTEIFTDATGFDFSTIFSTAALVFFLNVVGFSCSKALAETDLFVFRVETAIFAAEFVFVFFAAFSTAAADWFLTVPVFASLEVCTGISAFVFLLVFDTAATELFFTAAVFF
jgi:hypothetical protein